jgi:hypothetical protein
MKIFAFVAAILLWIFPARAQNRSAGASGGGGFGAGSINANMLPHTPVASFDEIVVQGSDSDYVPSTFVPFEAAVRMGEAALAYRPKSLGEVAVEYRAAKKHAQKL